MIIRKVNIYLKNIFISCPFSYYTIFILIFLLLNQNAGAVTEYAKKNVIFGGDAGTPPYELIDKNGLPSGFSVELTQAIAEEIGWSAEIKLGDAEYILKEFESGKIDIIEKADYSAERETIYEYSLPYHEFRYSVFINTGDNDYFKIHRLEGLTPVSFKGSFVQEYIKKNFPGKEIKVIERLIETISYISLEKNSFTILDKYLGLYLIKKYDIENVAPAGDRSLRIPGLFREENREHLRG